MLHASKNLEEAANQLDVGRHVRHLGMLDHMIARLTITTSIGTQTSDYTLFEMTTIGRAPGSTIVVDAHALISRQHATIELRHGHFHLFDHSLNGTWLNGQKLMHGDRGCQLRCKDVSAAALLPTAAASPCSAVTMCNHSHARVCMCSQEIALGRTSDAFRAHIQVLDLHVTRRSCEPLGDRLKRQRTCAAASMPLEDASMRFQAGGAGGAGGADAGAGAEADAGAGVDAGADAGAGAGAGAGAAAGALDADAAAAAGAPEAAPLAASGATTVDILKQWWVVFGNDPNDAAGVRNVLLAAHSAGKGEVMVSAAFPLLTPVQVAQFIDMEAFDVFKNKNGGTIPESIADAKAACRRLVALAEMHGSALRVLGCGGGMDRLVQISTTTGFIEPDKMRPLTYIANQAVFTALGIRHHQRSDGRYGTLNLSSTSDGTGTYKVEILRKGAVTTTFFLGVYPHPGSMSWGSVETRTSEHIKFLTALATGTPAQPHVVRIDADLF